MTWAPTASSVLVEVGTSAGVHIRGRLGLRGSRVLDSLNQWNDPVLTLAQVEEDGARATAVLPRAEMLWVCPLEVEPDAGDESARVDKVARSVVLYTGPYRIEGQVHTFPKVRWVDFFESPGRQFFPLTNARISGPSGDLERPFLAVNVARLLTLIAPDED